MATPLEGMAVVRVRRKRMSAPPPPGPGPPETEATRQIHRRGAAAGGADRVVRAASTAERHRPGTPVDIEPDPGEDPEALAERDRHQASLLSGSGHGVNAISRRSRSGKAGPATGWERSQ